jgi:hypothetical protein
MRLLVVGGVLAAVRSANADPTPAPPPDPAFGYPIEVVDRPLVLPSGVWRLDVSLDRTWYAQRIVDASGNMTTILTSSGHEHDADIALAIGAGGRVEIFGHVVFQLAEVGAAVLLDPDLGTVSVSVQDYLSTSYRQYEYEQHLGYSFVRTLIPQLLRIGAGVGAQLSELSVTPSGQPAMSGTVVSVSAGVQGIVQLHRRVALFAGVSMGGPISYSTGLVTDAHPTLHTYGTLNVGFHRWDLYAQGGADDLTRTTSPWASVGFVHRWF